MPKLPGSARALDLQLLKQAIHSAQRATELFIKNDDADALAQAELAERLLGEFVESRMTRARKR